jgi:hypothetical protein
MAAVAVAAMADSAARTALVHAAVDVMAAVVVAAAATEPGL